ncbi:MAG TPA: TolC family protein [Bryobacteraceae bacterium]|nr:TolC family protein [Bryobacteraceae bacterium]
MRLRNATLVCTLIVPLCAQQAPPSPERAWPVAQDSRFQADAAGASGIARPTLDPNHVYTLPELVDIAERNNPDTRAIWEQAKQRAADAGVARSALFPTVAALASASYSQYSLLVTRFYHQDLATFPATLSVNYTVFDFGARDANIDQARANLLAADFTFNDTHRRVIFQVAEAYYRLLDATSQEEAAQATLTDAQTVQQAIEARLANGLATLPDVLEARAATAQARYELVSIRGLEDIAHGVLANVLGIAPAAPFRVEDVSKAPLPSTVEEPVQTIIARALSQRPDLLAEVARLRSTYAMIRGAHAAYYPALSFAGDWGHRDSYGSQNFNPAVASHIYPYSAQLNLSWTLFDGGARRNELARAEEQRREAQAQVAVSRDQIENEIWTAYSNLKTAQGQREAADALLQAAEQSYSAATQSFHAGVRTFIDVTTAQRDLARARTAEASARVQVLTALADLAFRAADPIRAAQH